MLVLLSIAYSNHFNNDFQFDDTHSIVNNGYIRDLKNIPLFFTDVRYSGTNLGNQGYRPVLNTLNAIDYWLAGGLKPDYFHADIFISYLILLALLYFLFNFIFKEALENSGNKFIALLAVSFYGLHTANAETINYICMRSDSFSTLCMVASLLLFIVPVTRKYYLYLVFLALAIGTKEVGVMGAPILFMYVLFFEENCSVIDLITFKNRQPIFSAFKKAFPALLTTIILFGFIRIFIVPKEYLVVGSDSSVETWKYFRTEWFVIAHYIGNFILPLDLSADPDFVIIDSILDRRVLLSLGLILTMLVIAVVTSLKKETRPVSFGIFWFFLALAPTSSFLVFGQIANDHRTFFPYIGLVISLSWWLRMVYLKYEEKIKESKYIRNGFALLYMVVILLHAYGIRERNKVWSSGESLWQDVALKSPNNGRALMNYALSLMAKGEYEQTLVYFKKTLALMPYWPAININMGILRDGMGHPEESEQYFQNAIRYQSGFPDGYYFYARWLQKQNRLEEAISQLEKGQSFSPANVRIAEFLSELKVQKAKLSESSDEQVKKIEKFTNENPSGGSYIELGLAYYKSNRYKECVDACEKALKMNPTSSEAYNMMGCAYNLMGQWEKGADACTKALKIDPNFQLAKNNLNWAKGNLPK